MTIYRFTFRRSTPQTAPEHALKEAIEDSTQLYQLSFLETIVVNLEVLADQEEPDLTNDTGERLATEIARRYHVLGDLISWQKVNSRSGLDGGLM